MTKETNNHPVTLEQVEEAMNHESTNNLSMDVSRKSYFNSFLGCILLTILGLLIWLVVERSKDDSISHYSRCFSITRYPGYTGSIDVSGVVCLEQSGVGNIYRYHFHHLPENSHGGWHVHSGSSCAESGGHYQGQLSYDPWVNTLWFSNKYGTAKNIVDMSDIAQNVEGRNLVVHAPDGTRVGCGEISW